MTENEFWKLCESKTADAPMNSIGTREAQDGDWIYQVQYTRDGKAYRAGKPRGGVVWPGEWLTVLEVTGGLLKIGDSFRWDALDKEFSGR